MFGTWRIGEQHTRSLGRAFTECIHREWKLIKFQTGNVHLADLSIWYHFIKC